MKTKIIIWMTVLMLFSIVVNAETLNTFSNGKNNETLEMYHRQGFKDFETRYLILPIFSNISSASINLSPSLGTWASYNRFDYVNDNSIDANIWSITEQTTGSGSAQITETDYMEIFAGKIGPGNSAISISKANQYVTNPELNLKGEYDLLIDFSYSIYVYSCSEGNIYVTLSDGANNVDLFSDNRGYSSGTTSDQKLSRVVINETTKIARWYDVFNSSSYAEKNLTSLTGSNWYMQFRSDASGGSSYYCEAQTYLNLYGVGIKDTISEDQYNPNIYENPINVSLNVGDQQTYLGTDNSTTEVKANITTSIINSLNSGLCTCSECQINFSDCIIPFNFYSQKGGNLSYTFLNIEYIEQSSNITILNEKTNEPFDINTTNETKITLYSDTDVLEFIFNETNIKEIPLLSNLQYMKLDYSYNDTSYYRTIIPDDYNNLRTWAINVLEDQAVQIILTMYDLTGQYTEGSAIVKKYIDNEEVEIIEQKFDLENKVTLYLMKDSLYTLTVKSNSGEERNLGYFIADVAGTKTITIPNIEFIQDSQLAENISIDWDSGENYIKMVYNDSTLTGTTYLSYKIYNISNEQIVYETESYNITLSSYLFNTNNETSYKACVNASHPVEGNINSCKIFWAEVGVINYNDNEKINLFKYGVSILIILAVFFLGSNAQSPELLAVATLIMFLTIKFNWLDFGTWINYVLLAFGGLFTVLEYYRRGEQKLGT